MNKLFVQVLMVFGFLVFIYLVFPAGGLYSSLIINMPEGVRGWYCSQVLSGSGVVARESNKASLLLFFVKEKKALPSGSFDSLYSVATRYKGDPIGIMALQVAFDTNEKDMICRLWGKESFRSSFIGKLEVYRQSYPERAADLGTTIASCSNG